MTDQVTAALWPQGQQEAARRALADDLQLGVVEQDPVEVPLRRLDATLTHLAPAVLPCGDGVLALRRVGRRTVSLVGPNGRLRLRREALIQALTREVHQVRSADVERLAAGARPHDLARFSTRHRWLSIVAGDELVPLGTRLRPADPRQASTVARRGSAVGLLLAAVLLQVGAYAVVLALWTVVGMDAIAGTLGQATAWAWLGLGGLWVGLQVTASWVAGRAAVEVSTLLRAGLLDGALAVPPDRVRHLGAGQLLGTVLQTRPIEALAGSGGPLALIGATQVLSGVVAAALGHRSVAVLTVLTVWLVITVLLAVGQARLEGRWADLRTHMTEELVERLVGHRTRLAQNARGMRDHADDEAQLELYERLSRRLDRVTTALVAMVPRGFVASALAVVVLPPPD
ncbi:MAG TPA: hypothetical protein VMM13_19090, partial [Euzebya sp.]|nr:hypothetical protein [Euzebya sp.]